VVAGREELRAGAGVNLRLNWRRMNFDAHHAIGVWTLAFVAWWAISDVYFGFYRQFMSAVKIVLPLVADGVSTGASDRRDGASRAD